MANSFINIHPEFYNVLRTFTKYRLGELVKTLMLSVSGEPLPRTSELAKAFSMLILEKKSKGTDFINIHSDYFSGLHTLTNYRLGEIARGLLFLADGEDPEKMSELSEKFILQICEKNGLIDASIRDRIRKWRETGNTGGRPPKKKPTEAEPNSTAETKKSKTNQKKPSISKSYPLEEQIPMVFTTESSPVMSDMTDVAEIKSENIVSQVKGNIEYEILTANNPEDVRLIDAFVNIIADTVTTPVGEIYIDKNPLPFANVKENLLGLTLEHIEYAIMKFRAYTKPITNKKKFILTLLYNARLEYELHIENEFNIAHYPAKVAV